MFPFKKHAAQPEAAPLNEKMQQIRTRLAQLNQGATPVGGDGATLGDDAPLPADTRAAIARDEDLVRGTLKAVGVDYDALIRTEAQEGVSSPYAMAVQANPALLQEVLSAQQPVLKALQVALNHKPKAEFAAKYGEEPEAIRAAIRAEVLAEGQLQDEATPVQAGLPFSRPKGGAKAAAPKGKGGLQEVFRR